MCTERLQMQCNTFYYSAQNGSESRFRDRCFLFFVLSCVTYYGLFYCTIGFVSHHRRLISPLELYCAIVSRYYLSFKLSGKVVKDLMRRVCVTVMEIQTWNVVKLFQENVVWLALKRNKGCWLNAKRTKRMRLVGEVGWSIGECRFIFTMPVAGWCRIEFIPIATSWRESRNRWAWRLRHARRT